jgi:transposase
MIRDLVIYLCFMANDETVTISRSEYEGMRQQIGYLTQQLAEMKRLIFGTKRERFISAENLAQGNLFNLPAAETIKQEEEEITYTRRKSGEKKQLLCTESPAHLPRKEKVIEPEAVPEGAKMIGQAVTEILEYEPATLYVRRIVRNKYILESTDEGTEIIIASLPTLPIPKGNAGAGLLAYLLISKFSDHLPFYRQVQMFKRQGINLDESTVIGWFTAASKLIEPLYETLKTKVISTDYLMADETPIPVLTKDKPGATHKGYHWV